MAKKIGHVSLLVIALAILIAPAPFVGVLGAGLLQKNPLARSMAKWFLKTRRGQKFSRSIVSVRIYLLTLSSIRQY
jgi:hypothetical protein